MVLQRVVFRDFPNATLLILDADVFLLQPFTIRDFACMHGRRCGLAPSQRRNEVQPCHVSGFPQMETIHAYPHVAVLMLDLSALPDLETLSLNPADFAEGYADSGGQLLSYLWRQSLRGRSSHASSSSSSSSISEGGARLATSAMKGGVLEYPVAWGRWWSDGLLTKASGAPLGKQPLAGPPTDAGTTEQAQVVVCWLEHSYLGLAHSKGDHDGSPRPDAPVAGPSAGPAEPMSDVGWCVLEGGACGRDGMVGGSDSCQQGLPDSVGGDVWMHARRSSDWDLLLQMARFEDESDYDRPSFVAQRESKWRRLQCIIGSLHYRIASHPHPHPRPRAPAYVSMQPPARLSVDMSSANHAFSRNGGVVYGDPHWFDPGSLLANDGRLAGAGAEGSGVDMSFEGEWGWELGNQAAVIVFKSGLESVFVERLELWGSWLPCRFKVSYVESAEGRLIVHEAEWLPLVLSSAHGKEAEGGKVDVNEAVRERVELRLASPVKARALRVMAVEPLGMTEGGLGTHEKCRVVLEEIVVI